MVQHPDESTPILTGELEAGTHPTSLSGTPTKIPGPTPAAKTVHWEEDFIEFLVAVVRLLLIAGFAAFRLGVSGFGQAISSAAVSDALRSVARDLQDVAVNTNTTKASQDVQLPRSDLPNAPEGPPVTDGAVAQEEECVESPITVSRGARVGVFRNS